MVGRPLLDAQTQAHGVDQLLHGAFARTAHVFAAYTYPFGFYYFELAGEFTDLFHAGLTLIFVGDIYQYHDDEHQ